ncbi:MAG: Rrf2 family transcriptional regulator [Proteobacteria bacterium]|nr:Rrf2 family transcriptional regulator [Pseudomonadota bacterium]
MRTSRQIEYALYGLFDLAYHGGPRPIRLSEVGRRQEIPARYLEQIFGRLRRAGLVRSKRGPGGGYLLARPAGQISLADIVLALQGTLLARAESDPAQGSPEFVWDLLEGALDESLARRTLEDLCAEAARRGLERAGETPAMYEI